MWFKMIQDALVLTGWTIDEIHGFIDLYPRVWLNAMRQRTLIDAVSNIEVFAAHANFR